MRSLIFAAAAAFSLACVAGGASADGYANGPYAWDAHGACRDASGAVVSESLCPTRPKPAACRDQDSGKPVACDAPGAVPPDTPNGPPH